MAAKKKQIKSGFIKEGRSGDELNLSKAMSFIKVNDQGIFLSVSFLILFYVFSDFLLLKNLYLFKDIGSDTLNVFYPQYIHLADYWQKYGMPKWSFGEGMGQNYFGNSFGNPFHFLYAIAGKENVPYLIIYVETIKIFLAGFFFFRFLKLINLSGFAAIAGALMYEFSGFMIIESGWYQFFLEGMCLSLLLWSLESYFRTKKFWFPVLAVALMASIQPFNLYLGALLAVAYTKGRELFNQADSIQTDQLPSKLFASLFKKIFQVGLIFLLGAGISSVFLFSSVEQIIQSPRGSGEDSYFHLLSSKPMFEFAEIPEYLSFVMRGFSSDILGNGSNYKGWTNYLESPMTYCSLLALLLIPQGFVGLSKSKRNVLLLLLLLCFVPFIFPFFRYAFWLFSGDYYRSLSLFLSIFLIFLASRAIHSIQENMNFSLKIHVTSILILLLVLYFPMAEKDHIIDSEMRIYITAFLLVYTALIFLLSKKSYQFLGLMLLFSALIIELSAFSSNSIKPRKTLASYELENHTGYNDHSMEAIKYVQKYDPSFFRINKDYSSGPAIHNSLNDAKAQGYYGTSNYNSFAQKNYVRFYQKVGITQEGNELQARWVPSLYARPMLFSMSSGKYLLSKRKDAYARGMGYDSLALFGDVILWKNRYALPFGFTYSKFISPENFANLSLNNRDKAMLSAFVIESPIEANAFFPYQLADTTAILTFDFYKALVDSLKRDTLQIASWNDNHIQGKIKLDQKKLLFLSIPFDKGWSCEMDGVKSELILCNFGFTGLIVDKGVHDIVLNYKPPYFQMGIGVSVAAIVLLWLLWFLQKKKLFNVF